MLLTYYTIRALAEEWGEGGACTLVGSTIQDAYSVARDELTLVLDSSDGELSSLRISVQSGNTFIFRQPGAGRPKKNVTSLLGTVRGDTVADIQVADRDRVLDIRTGRGRLIRCTLFGSRANIFVAREGDVVEAFRERGADELPAPRAAPDPNSIEELQARWPKGAQPVEKALFKALPLIDPWLAREIVERAGLAAADACLLDEAGFEALLGALEAVRAELAAPRPVLYREDRTPVAFALIPLSNPPAQAEHFETVDEAVRALVRATLSDRRFRALFGPLRRSLEASAVRGRQRLDAMTRELNQPSRADTYERWGHLLMAGAANQVAGADHIALANLFGDGEEVRIPLDPALTATQNANRYYDRARRSRRAREEAQRRIEAAGEAARSAADLLAGLLQVTDLKGLKAFTKQNQAALAMLRGTANKASEAVPFRRYVLESGEEVLVGRNARQNDALTFRHAAKHDYWLHARGVSGSHTVLRRPNKTRIPPKSVIEQAASIAAWHSKARGSALVPVIVTERKYVRRPRKAPVGTVLVEREEVVIVPPGLPGGASPD